MVSSEEALSTLTRNHDSIDPEMVKWFLLDEPCKGPVDTQSSYPDTNPTEKKIEFDGAVASARRAEELLEFDLQARDPEEIPSGLHLDNDQASHLAAAGMMAEKAVSCFDLGLDAQQTCVRGLSRLETTSSTECTIDSADCSACTQKQAKSTCSPLAKRSRGSSSQTRLASLTIKLSRKKKYVQYNGTDVLSTRGGSGNKHKGNIAYREMAARLRPKYLKAIKSSKTKISQQLVDQVHLTGGRFLKKDNIGWFEMNNDGARTKCAQLLREDYTLAQRAAKRARYPKRKSVAR